MRKSDRIELWIAAGTCLLLSFSPLANTQAHPPISNPDQKEKTTVHHASGAFEVSIIPQAPDAEAESPSVGRMILDKRFHGDLEATSSGQMLAIRTDVEGSAGYVAMERITGTLDGRSGSFALQHSGIMTRGVPQLSVTVVPDSGTGELVGIAGEMTIDVVDGKHFYEFKYTLPDGS